MAIQSESNAPLYSKAWKKDFLRLRQMRLHKSLLREDGEECVD